MYVRVKVLQKADKIDEGCIKSEIIIINFLTKGNCAIYARILVNLHINVLHHTKDSPERFVFRKKVNNYKFSINGMIRDLQELLIIYEWNFIISETSSSCRFN